MSDSKIDFNDIEQWAAEQWGRTCLGDKRRTRRAVKLGEALASQPGEGLPTQTQSWGDLKAAYKLLHETDVTHAALIRPHCEQVRERAVASGAKVVLQIQDTTELDYTNHPRTVGLGRIGDDHGRGLLVHSCLTVIPTTATPQIMGVAAQQVWTRPERAFTGHETRAERDARAKESDVWATVVEEIGSAPLEGVKFVSVGDRASDIFSYVRKARANGWHVLLRVTQNRIVTSADGMRDKLLDYARRLREATTKEIELRGRDGKPKRRVTLKVSFGAVLLHAPQIGSERKQAAIQGWVVRCWSEAEETGEAIEWVLFTTIEVADAAQALEVVEWYSHRWLIEEYHKCLKSGCRIEASQLQSAEALASLLGFKSIVALRMLQLREKSRTGGAAKATEEVPREFVEVVRRKFGWAGTLEQITLREFWRGVARLGGFIGRRSDGEPGWQTLWRGWQRLQDLAWSLQMKT